MVPADSDRIPRVPPYSGAISRASRISDTGLSPPAVELPSSFSYACRFALVMVLLPRSSDRFGLLPFRSPLLGKSFLFSLPPGTEMFQFPGYRLPDPLVRNTRTSLRVGSPIRISTGLSVLTAHRRISLFAASFFAGSCLGIPHTPFLALPLKVCFA